MYQPNNTYMPEILKIRSRSSIQLQILEQKLEIKDFAKKWGIMIDSDLSWKYHIDFIHHIFDFYYYSFLFERPETSAGQAI